MEENTLTYVLLFVIFVLLKFNKLAQTPLQYLKKNYPKQKDSLSVFLKKFDDQKIIGIQKLVEDASEKAWKEVDCLACANCCKVMTPTFTKKDLKRISTFLGMTETEMYDKWLKELQCHFSRKTTLIQL